MPIAKLSTGINLYHESYGRGEAIVFIPGTGFAGNVWIESQAEELARSHQVIVHDPRGCPDPITLPRPRPDHETEVYKESRLV